MSASGFAAVVNDEKMFVASAVAGQIRDAARSADHGQHDVVE